MFPLFLICLYIGSVASDRPSFAETIHTRSTAAKGVLMCGQTPAAGVKVRLFRKPNNDAKEILSVKETSSSGHFEIEGDTVGRSEQNIEPMIRFYHRCDDDLKRDVKKVGYRTFAIKYPKEHVTLGRVPRKPFDVGKLNLQVIYPKETRDKKVIDNQ